MKPDSDPYCQIFLKKEYTRYVIFTKHIATKHIAELSKIWRAFELNRA